MTTPSEGRTHSPEDFPTHWSGHYCCACFTHNGMPCCNPNHEQAMTALPEWADAWLPGMCGCGARLVMVEDIGGRQAVCRLSGRVECDRPGVNRMIAPARNDR